MSHTPETMAVTTLLLLIGGTGLVGSLVVQRASGRNDIRLRSLARRPADMTGTPFDFEAMIQNPQAVVASAAPEGADVSISCLGTTLAKAGSQDAMWRIDHDYVLAFAKGARALGARQFIMMTSAGAGGNGFYLNMKGAVEKAVADLGFPRLDIIRPGLLLGDRPERRPLEKLGQAMAPAFNPLLRGRLSRYRAIPAWHVADAILALAGEQAAGTFIHENDALRALATA